MILTAWMYYTFPRVWVRVDLSKEEEREVNAYQDIPISVTTKMSVAVPKISHDTLASMPDS